VKKLSEFLLQELQQIMQKEILVVGAAVSEGIRITYAKRQIQCVLKVSLKL
jgi:predicted ATP-grasp superfamily ATP-dependent carboligase